MPYPKNNDLPEKPRTRPCARCGRPFNPNEWYAYTGSRNGKRYWKSLCKFCDYQKAQGYIKAHPNAPKRWHKAFRERQRQRQRQQQTRLEQEPINLLINSSVQKNANWSPADDHWF